MAVLLAVVVYWIRLLRRPLNAALKRRHVGSSAIFLLGFGVIVLWDRQRPAGLSAAYTFGEIAGVLAVYLMTWTLLLATRARWLEPWFGGLDQMYLWHRRSAIGAMLLLVPHVLITGGARPAGDQPNLWGARLGVLSAAGLLGLVAISFPRIGRIFRFTYERWLFLHRLIGLFLVLGIAHGLLVDLIIGSSLTLQVVYLGVGTLGISSYMYDELLMRHLLPTADYTISIVTRRGNDIVEMQLTPKGAALTPRAGQFVFLRIGGEDRWREHPFSVAALDSGGRLRLSVRALGRDTRRMHERLAPGLPATVTGPYGMFDFTLGGRQQVWIAGGIGVVPFLNWLTTLKPDDDYSVDLFYSVPTEAEAVYLPELTSLSSRLPFVRIHHVFTRSDGHMTANRVIDALRIPIRGVHVFMCGPLAMVEDISSGLRKRGVPRDYVHAENFAFR
jgi:predicted ferric reductase